MRIVRSIDRKVLRDAWDLRAQLLAIACVIACGLGVFLGMRSTMESLESARSAYYARQRFGHVFVGLTRAPERVAERLRRIPGVQHLQTRVKAEVTLDVPGMQEPATGRLVSIPDRGRPAVNDFVLRSGRLPAHGRGAEVVASEAFATAHGLRSGARLRALVNGRYQELEVVGTALSPEFTYAAAPGTIIPDERRFGILWMQREPLAAAFDMQGAFNDVSLRLARDVVLEDVLARVDDVLDPYGGVGAIGRDEQESAFFLSNELRQLATFSWSVPFLFLAVAAFLLNVVVGRIVSGQREEIAALKAFGYRDREVGLHYAKLVGIVLAAGSLLGIVLGAWVGSSMVRLYGNYYRFPELPYRLGGAEVVLGLSIAGAAAVAGTWSAIRHTVRLPPAEAMRPEAPPVYRATLLERLGLDRAVPTAARIVLRELERQPRRALLSVAGIALATAMTILNAFNLDAVHHMLNVQFGLSQREDVQLTLYEPRALESLAALRHLPGVLRAEPYRGVPVRLANGHRSKLTAITGLGPGTTLANLMDTDLRSIEVPAEGLVVSRKLADLLAVEVGDRVRFEVKEGTRPTGEMVVARVADTFVGLPAYMRLEALCRLLGEAPTLDGAWLLVDEGRLDALHRAVKQTPLVAGVASRDNLLGEVRRRMDENLGVVVVISLSFSFVMALGVLYNTVRITLAERARDLASLRVLGFHRREVAAILLGDLGVLVGVATPLGLVLGHLMAGALASSPGYDTEQFRLPFVVYPSTYALATLTVLVAACLSAWNAWRKLDRFDIVTVLKSHD